VIRRVKSRISVVVPTNIATLRKIRAAKSNEKANSHVLMDLSVAAEFLILIAICYLCLDERTWQENHVPPVRTALKLLGDLAGCMLHDLLT